MTLIAHMNQDTIKPITTAGALADRLRAEINIGRWQTGEVLRQEDLADEFGVSRIPIREALALLQSEGLITIEHYRGARISRLSAEQIEEIFDLRLILECDLLERALPAHNDHSIRELQRIQTQLEMLDHTPLAWLATHRDFHDQIYAPANRPRSMDLLKQLRAPIERFCIHRFAPGLQKADWSEGHRRLIAAIRAGDIAAALRQLTTHLKETRTAVIAAASMA